MKRAYKTTYRTTYKTAHLGSKLNYPVAVAKDSLGNIITPTEYNIDGVDYVAHIFNESGTLEVTSGGLIDYLIVGGGGSGGSYGGGGSGGFLSGAAILAIGSFPVTVGDGGVAVSSNIRGYNGDDSSFNNKTAKGGGGGAQGNDAPEAVGKDGGSGGGGGASNVVLPTDYAGGLGTPGQGNNGGYGRYSSITSELAGGGGGGAGQVGEDAAATGGGNGGNGLQSSLSGVNTYYAGGGGGGRGNTTYTIPSGGEGGGGNGKGGAATPNTGGGGGAARPATTSGPGGSGIVIVRYKKKITPFNIFIVAGQSNTDGRVATTNVNAPDYLSDNLVDNVKVWNGTSLVNYDLTDIGQSGNGSSWVSADSSGKYSFAHVALKKVAETIDNVIVCQVTQGSSPLAAVSNAKGSWNYDYEAIPVGTPKLLESLENRFAALQSYLNSINRSYVVRGIFFHQGEWDDDSIFNEEDEYAVNFSGLVAKIRSFTNKPYLPIIYGTVPAASAANSLIIKNAHLDFAENDANAYCRDNDDLTLFDSYHFDALSSNLFGEWAADQF